MSRVDADAMRRYETARDELVAQLLKLEDLLEDERRALVRFARLHLQRGKFVLAVVGEFSSGKSFFFAYHIAVSALHAARLESK